MKMSEMKEWMESYSFEELLDAIDIYRVRELSEYIRTMVEMPPMNRSLRIEVVNILKAVDEMNDEQFEKVNAKLEELVTIDDLKELE